MKFTPFDVPLNAKLEVTPAPIKPRGSVPVPQPYLQQQAGALAEWGSIATSRRRYTSAPRLLAKALQSKCSKTPWIDDTLYAIMAHAITIHRLTSDLVHSIATQAKDDALLVRMRDHAVKSLRNTTHARTNQFDINSKLEGLVEKFAVLNRDDLSEALQLRLDDLPSQSKWMPEILSLLLQLSDRPLEKTSLEDTEALAKQPKDDEPQLSWADLLADAPRDEAGVWDDVERGYHSSGDEQTTDGEGDSVETPPTEATSFGLDDIVALARLQIVQPDDSALNEIQTGSSRFDPDKQHVPIPELELIRDTLFMLHGLPSSIFTTSRSTGHVSFDQPVALSTASQPMIIKFLSHCAEIGSSLNALRNWVHSDQRVAYLQSCQASIQQLLIHFSSDLATLEQRYLGLSKDTVVSIIDVRSEVERLSHPLVHIYKIVDTAEQQTKSSPFALLDALYGQACMAEMSGNALLFAILARVLFAGLRTYLKPVSRWTQAGIVDADDKTFLIEEVHSDCDPGRLWYDRYTKRTSTGGGVCAPKFMQGFANSIFAMGKARAFLRALGRDIEVENNEFEFDVPNFSEIEASLDANHLSPFSQMLSNTLESWIGDIGEECTPLLRTVLLNDHGLLRTIDGLDHVFCSRNGRTFQTFADTLFWRINHGRDTWRNAFLLSELAQSTFGSAGYLDAHDLSIRIDGAQGSSPLVSSIQQLATINLEYLFPWPFRNITCSPSPLTYSKAFTFLLQVYRAKYLLQPQIFDLSLLETRTTNLSKRIAAAIHLRQHLLVTVDVLHAHITSTCQAVSMSLRKAMETTDGIDAMAAVWAAHDKQLETSLLLARNLAPIREAITGQLELCERFARVWERLTGHEGLSADGEADKEQHETEHGKGQTPVLREETVSAIKAEFEKSTSFIVAGLRGISRAGGNAALEALAERLEWSVH